MFLKSNVSFFPSIFENKKDWKLQKKGLKSKKKTKEKQTTKETLVRISLVCFPLLHGVEAQHDHVQDTTKRGLLLNEKRD